MKLLCLAMVLLSVNSYSVDVSSALHIDYVEELQAVRAADVVLVACRLSPVFQFTEKVRVLEEIQKTVKEKLSVKDVVVSPDIDVWFKVEKLSKEYNADDITRLVTEVKKRNGALGYENVRHNREEKTGLGA